MTDVVIRPWLPPDAAALDSLLDPEPDPFWLVERTGRHGISARPDRFAITLVAEDASGVVGAATLFENHYHPGRYPTIVEVAPRRRREGIARRLLGALAEQRPAPLPMAAKLQDTNEAAIRFGAALGMRTYQHCPIPCVDPSDEATRIWAVRQSPPPGVHVVALGDADQQEAIDAMVEHYRWVHDHWSPMGDRELIAELWTDYVNEAEATFSSVAIVDGRIAALSLVWVEDGRVDCVAETRTRDEPNGTVLVAGCIARSLSELDHAGMNSIEFDGHDDDPHLQPVIDSMPRVRRNPMSLVEINF